MTSWRRSRLVRGIIIVVVIVWAASFVADVFVQNYDPPNGINEIMMVIVGALVASQANLEDDRDRDRRRRER